MTPAEAAVGIVTHVIRFVSALLAIHSVPRMRSTTAVWAMSIPRLNAASAGARWVVATPMLARLDAKPSPWTTPMVVAIHGRASLARPQSKHSGGDDGQRDHRLDQTGRRRNQIEIGETQAEGVANRESSDELHGAPPADCGDGRSGNGQGEHQQEQEVVGAESDVVDTETEERCDARPGFE